MNKCKLKIIRACTVPLSVSLVEGMLPKLKESYDVMLLSSPGRQMDEAIAKHGIKGIAVPMERHISLTHDIKALFQLIKVFRREKPVMVHSMTPKAGLLCMMAARIASVPVRVHTFTGLVWPTEKGLKRKVLMMTDCLTCACATHVIPEGEGVKNDLLKNGITKKPIRVLGYGNVRGIDMERFRISEKIKMKSQQLAAEGIFTFLFVGRIVRDKGINELVSAFNRLNVAMPATRLLLVGPFEDDLDPISDATRQTMDKNINIEAVGIKSSDELLVYYTVADCYVHPSYREGFPNAVLEAGAMGLPCIVTDINGSREIIVEGENGVIVPPKDEQALYDAMLRMMKDDEGRKRMAGNARKMIADRFEQGYICQCLLDFYDEILKQ